MLLIASLLGAFLGSTLALIPALHVYNLAGLALLYSFTYPDAVPPEVLAMFLLGAVVGYAIVNTVPAVFFSAPDESAIFISLPGQRYLMEGRGFEVAALTGAGGLGAVAVLVLLAPFASAVFPPLRALVQPHLHWIVGVIIVFMLMSEWPRGGSEGTPWQRFFGAWKGLGAGLLTFLLSGIFGMTLMYRTLVPVEMAFQNLLPAFVGLFSIPASLVALFVRARVPAQTTARSLDVTPDLLARSIAAGSMGGLFAAFFPAITGGVGGLLAGHATAQRDERVFIVSQGASKVAYYVGAYLLFFVPRLHLSRGGLAGMISTQYTAATPATYVTAVAAIALSGGLAYGLLLVYSRFIALRLAHLDQRLIAAATLVVLVGVVYGLTGLGGLGVAAVGTAIGLIPLLFATRRMNCLGVLLLPLFLNMAGLGGVVARWLGLV